MLKLEIQSLLHVQNWHAKMHCDKFDTDAKRRVFISESVMHHTEVQMSSEKISENNSYLVLFHTHNVTLENLEYSA